MTKQEYIDDLRGTFRCEAVGWHELETVVR
jgi:hypothetical protein